MKTRYLVMLVLVGLLLSGCGFVFNQPLVGPNGATALFVGNDGTYSMLPEGDCHLALLHNGGAVTHLRNVTSEGDSGVLDWSADGRKVLFMDTEQDEFGQPIAWNVLVSEVQSNSQPVKLFRSEEIIMAPAFTEKGNITYLEAKDDSDLPQLMLYDVAHDQHTVLKDDVISYKRFGWEGTLFGISQTSEGALKLAHIFMFDLSTKMTEEVASFFLSQGMEEMIFILPSSFLWDVSPSGAWVALSLNDQAVITPPVENKDDQPSLYLIDRGEESAYKLSGNGVVPAFSPDGGSLAYVGATGEEKKIQVISLYDLESKETRTLDNTIGAVTLFWIDDNTLGYAVELKNNSYRLMRVTISTGEVAPLSLTP